MVFFLTDCRKSAIVLGKSAGHTRVTRKQFRGEAVVASLLPSPKATGYESYLKIPNHPRQLETLRLRVPAGYNVDSHQAAREKPEGLLGEPSGSLSPLAVKLWFSTKAQPCRNTPSENLVKTDIVSRPGQVSRETVPPPTCCVRSPVNTTERSTRDFRRLFQPRPQLGLLFYHSIAAGPQSQGRRLKEE
jgi:hypothetical protein